MESMSIKKAAIIYAAAKYSTVVTSLIFTAFLARLLKPEYYGIVAVVFVFVTFFRVLSDMGLGSSVIQNKDLTKDDISSIFTFSVYASVVLAILFCVLSIPISIIYEDGVYISICCSLSVVVLLSTLNIIPSALMMKDKKFLTIGIRMIVVNVVSGIAAVILALYGAKYYSLVIQVIIASLISFIWNYNSTRPKFMLRFDRNSLNKIKSYGSYQFAYNILNYFSRNLDYLLIGKVIGTSQLAYYSQAYSLMMYPLTYLTYVINPVLHPILSEYQDNRNYIYEQYIKIVKILSLTGVFITAFCFSASREIVLIIFGSQWLGSINCFKILSISILFQMTTSSAGSIYLSVGNTKLMFKSGMVYTALMVTGTIMGVRTGDINIVALYVSAVLILRFFIDYYFLIKLCLGYSVASFYKLFIPDIFILFVLLAATKFAAVFSPGNLFLLALFKLGISFSVFIVLLLITKQYKYFAVILPKKKIKQS